MFEFAPFRGRAIHGQHKDNHVDPTGAGHRTEVRTPGLPPFFPHTAIQALGDYLQADERFQHHLASLCERLPGFARIIEELAWTELDRHTASRLLRLLGDQILASRDPRMGERLWQVFRREAASLVRLLRTLPVNYRAKALSLFEAVISCPENRFHLARGLRRLQILARGFCRPPFAAENQPGPALVALCNLEGKAWGDLLNMGPKTRQQLDQFCQKLDRVRIMARGLTDLSIRDPNFTVASLDRDPGLFLNSVFTLGGLPADKRQRALDSWQQHPLLTLEASTLPLDRLVPAMRQHLVVGFKNPIPKKLSAYLQGKVELTPGQLERMHGLLMNNLALSQIELLRVLTRGFWSGTASPTSS